MALHAATVQELIYLRDRNFSRLFLAGLENPPVVFACQINQVFATHDKVAQVAFDNVTAGVYTDVLPGMTIWIGTAEGAYDVGMARARKAFTDTLAYLGEESELDLADDLYLTVVDEMGLWAKHPNGTKMDYDVTYSNQHTVFDPIVCMGANVVLDADAYPVTVTFPDAPNSRVFGGTIAAWAWTATAGTLTDETTDAPTLTIEEYPTDGVIRVALTLTSDGSKTFTGYRYIRVYDDSHRPITEFNVDSFDAAVESGGWGFSVTMYGEATKAVVRDRAPVIVFARDYYGGTKISIGQAAGRENIVCAGWVVGESVVYDPLAGTVKFDVRGAAYWLDKMTAFPLLLEIPKKSPTKWNQMPGLSVDLAVWHLFHWRSTLDAIADTAYTDDARLTPKMEAAASSVWQQAQKIAKRIFATGWVDQQGGVSLNVLPQMTPAAERAWVTVQDIEKGDWVEQIDMQRRVVTESAMVSLTAKKGTPSGGSSTFYSLANGHIYKRHGAPEMVDDIMADSQEQANELAGLWCGWKNNTLPTINIKLAANNRLITLFPNQFLSITIDAADNERGIVYAGNLVLKSVAYAWDAEQHCFTTEIACEAETFAEPNMIGDIPNDAAGVDMSIPPMDVDMPEMPALPSLILPPSMENANHPTDVVLVSANYGVLYTIDFDEDDPTWQGMNNGLSQAEYESIGQIVRTASGGLYIMCDGDVTAGYNKIYYCQRLGATWQLVATADPDDELIGVFSALGNNPLSATQVAILGGLSNSGGSWNGSFFLASTSGLGARTQDLFMRGHYRSAVIWTQTGWYLFTQRADGFQGLFFRGSLWKMSSAGGMEDSGISGAQGAYNLDLNFQGQYFAAGCGSLDKVFYWNAHDVGYGLFAGVDNQTTSDAVNPKTVQALACSPTGSKIMVGSGGTYVPYRSADGGASWENLSTIIPVGMSVFENCGDDSRWIYGGGTNLKLTVDHGATNFNKEGNLTYIAPLIDITQIRFIK